jgi:GAF domain-containing protein
VSRQLAFGFVVKSNGGPSYRVPAFAHGSLLARHGIESGAAFPVFVGPKLAAVIELLSFDPLERDPQTEVVATELTAQLQAAVQRHWTERAAEPARAPSSSHLVSPAPS